MHGGDTLRFVLPVEAGRYLHVVIDQRDLAAEVSLMAPDGASLLALRARPTEYGRRSLSTLIAKPGRYMLELKVSGPAALSGDLRIDLEPPRMPMAADRQRIDADAALRSARDLPRPPTPVDHAQVLTHLNAALEAYRALGDRYWEARTLDALADLQGNESSWAMAIDSANQALAIYRSLNAQLEEGEALKRLGRLYAGWGATKRGEGAVPEAVAVSEVKLEDLPGFYARFRERLHESLGADSGLRAGEQLEGLVELTAEEDGRVREARWIAGDEPLREAALAAAISARFAPRRAAFTVRLPFKYALK